MYVYVHMYMYATYNKHKLFDYVKCIGAWLYFNLPLRAAEMVFTLPSIPVPASCVEESVISLDSMPAVDGGSRVGS